MNGNVFFNILDAIFYPIIILVAIIGLVAFFRGVFELSKPLYREQHIPWYNYPTILNGIAIISFALFFCLFLTGMHTSNVIARIFMYLGALAFGGIFLFCTLRVRRFTALLPTKRLKRKQTQPKD